MEWKALQPKNYACKGNKGRNRIQHIQLRAGTRQNSSQPSINWLFRVSAWILEERNLPYREMSNVCSAISIVSHPKGKRLSTEGGIQRAEMDACHSDCWLSVGICS